MKSLYKFLISSFFCLLSFHLAANDVVTFTWSGFTGRQFKIHATTGEQFTVDWGDGSEITTFTGLGPSTLVNPIHWYPDEQAYNVIVSGSSQNCRFTSLYVNFLNNVSLLNVANAPSLEVLYCSDNQLTSLDVSNNTALKILAFDNNLLTSVNLSHNPALESLYCAANKLSSLNLSTNLLLVYINCQNNALSLPNLYTISDQHSGAEKILGTQTLPVTAVALNVPIDLSANLVLGGVSTTFVVKKGSALAVENVDYTLLNGFLIFKTSGSYSVEMSNTAIVSRPDRPALVIAPYNAGSVATQKNESAKLSVYPNPTTGLLTIDGFDLLVKNDTGSKPSPLIRLFDLSGKKVFETKEPSFDMSSLPAGIYILKAVNRTATIVKQ